MELDFSGLQPANHDPAVIIGVTLGALLITAGGFLVLRPFGRGLAFTFRALTAQFLALVALLLCAHLIESLVPRGRFVMAQTARGGIVCSFLAGPSLIPFVAVLPLIAGALLLAWRRASIHRRGLGRGVSSAHA